MFDSVEFPDDIVSATTLKASASCEGIGLHSGQPVRMTLNPAPAGSGIVFRRRDLLATDGPKDQISGLKRVSIKVTPHAVTATTLGTVLANRHGVTLSTVEHILSALAGCGVDHALIDIDGPEVPIMDGSADPFVELIDSVGVRELPSPRRVLVLKKPVRVEIGDAYIDAVPLAEHEPLAPVIDVTVDYKDPSIGRQRLVLEGGESDYRSMIAAARTFCDLKDVEAMRAQGLALGGSLDNAIVVDEGTVLNEGGLRLDEEFVRHKVLDLIGDLNLLCAPLAARIVAYKPGHGINSQFARAVLDQDAVESVELVPTLTGLQRVGA